MINVGLEGYLSSRQISFCPLRYQDIRIAFMPLSTVHSSPMIPAPVISVWRPVILIKPRPPIIQHESVHLEAQALVPQLHIKLIHSTILKIVHAGSELTIQWRSAFQPVTSASLRSLATDVAELGLADTADVTTSFRKLYTFLTFFVFTILANTNRIRRDRWGSRLVDGAMLALHLPVRSHRQ
jgi:hypothetical protein